MVILTTGRNIRSGGRFNDSTSNTCKNNGVIFTRTTAGVRPERHMILVTVCQVLPPPASHHPHCPLLELTPWWSTTHVKFLEAFVTSPTPVQPNTHNKAKWKILCTFFFSVASHETTDNAFTLMVLPRFEFAASCKNKGKVLLRFELRSLDSKSNVLTITLQDHLPIWPTFHCY